MLQHHPSRRYQNTLSIEDPRQTPQPLAYDKRTNNSNWLSVLENSYEYSFQEKIY